MSNALVEEYYQLNSKESEYHKSIDTIHAVKGASMDAALLFLLSDSRGQNISLKDFQHNVANNMTESQRMIHVACSRARQFLALAVPKSITDEEIRRILDMIDIDIRHI